MSPSSTSLGRPRPYPFVADDTADGHRLLWNWEIIEMKPSRKERLKELEKFALTGNTSQDYSSMNTKVHYLSEFVRRQSSVVRTPDRIVCRLKRIRTCSEIVDRIFSSGELHFWHYQTSRFSATLTPAKQDETLALFNVIIQLSKKFSAQPIITIDKSNSIPIECAVAQVVVIPLIGKSEVLPVEPPILSILSPLPLHPQFTMKVFNKAWNSLLYEEIGHVVASQSDTNSRCYSFAFLPVFWESLRQSNGVYDLENLGIVQSLARNNDASNLPGDVQVVYTFKRRVALKG
ncbi:hypothetical protein CPB83DRAFT_838526 [Crepidotus variabilis]|uniref:Uncharacterized protein n=1 Tax=Crepidotus variabilis TaxID=179855 RepID=A0A9P6E9D1_9AGAR|nr:hypothetical protein CPB83DRAFT_838526 [Crepidotus variabilis]